MIIEAATGEDLNEDGRETTGKPNGSSYWYYYIHCWLAVYIYVRSIIGVEYLYYIMVLSTLFHLRFKNLSMVIAI